MNSIVKSAGGLFRTAVLAAACCAFFSVAALAATNVEDVSVKQDSIFIKLKTPVKFSTQFPPRVPKLILDLEDTYYPLGAKTFEAPSNSVLKRLRVSQQKDTTGKKTVRFVLDLAKPLQKGDYDIIQQSNGIMISLVPATGPAAEAAAIIPAPAPKAAAPAAAAKQPEQEDKTIQEEADAQAAAAMLARQPEPEPIVKKSGYIAQPSDTKLAQRRVTLNLRGMPLPIILEAISRQTGASFIVSKDLPAKSFYALMENVTLRDALRALLEVHGLSYEQVGVSNTFVVKELARGKARLATRVFHLKNVQLTSLSSRELGENLTSKVQLQKRDEEALKDASKVRLESGKSVGIGFLDTVSSMLSEQGKMEIYPETNSLIISDLPENFPAIEDIVETLDQPIPQVMIEAYFVETNANNMKNLGISFGETDGTLGSFTGNSRIISFPFSLNGSVWPISNTFDFSTQTDSLTVDQKKFYGGVNFGILSFQQLTAVLKAIQTSGESKFLSKPRALTLNNKPAEIASTSDTVVEFNSSQLINSQGLAQTVKNPVRKTTGIRMWVTPQVNENGSITMAITPEITRPETSTYFPSENVLDSHRQAITTTVRVRDGQTVLIGGLLTTEDSKTVRKVPLLGNIPLIGLLFTSTSNNATQKELLIFITPRIVPQ